MTAFVNGSGNLSSASVQTGAVYARPVDKSDLEAQEWASKIQEVKTYWIGDVEVPLTDGTVIISFTADGWEAHPSVSAAKESGHPYNLFSVRHGVDYTDLELWAIRNEVWE